MKIEMSKAEEEEARLTAYVLGELDAEETRAVESLLKESAEARASLGEIRETAEMLSAEFSKEPALSLREDQLEAITQADEAEEKVVHGRFMPIFAVAACACLFAAAGLKDYVGSLEKLSEPTVTGQDLKDEVAEAEPAAALEEPLGSDGEKLSKEGNATKRVSSAMAGKPDSLPQDAEALVKSQAEVEKLAAPAAPRVESPVHDSLVAPAKKAKDRAIARSKSPNYLAAKARPLTEADAAPAPARELRGSNLDATMRRKVPGSSIVAESARVEVEEADQASDSLVKEEKPGLRLERKRTSEEEYGKLVDNDWVSTWDDGLSTFAIDVDTGSYPNVRRFLKQRGALPPKDAVRVEEMINYFNYDYPEPEGDAPFSVNMEVASCPWAKDHRLLRVGLKGKSVDVDKRPPSNLVFLVDVSGSMRSPEKLGLLKTSLVAMVEELNEDDRVGIVTYSGSSGVALEPTHGDLKEKITKAVKSLSAGGSTNGAAGIATAYSLAQANFVEGGTNRVILATDGDFNFGVSDTGDLIQMVEKRAGDKIFLTVLGFGQGNLKENRMEQIADKGNGSYHYIDSEKEGEKVLVRGLGATLVTVAKDVKVQLDFNPAKVSKYRLIGYANRMMPDAAFNDPSADAGEIGAGHTVTALYEIVPTPDGEVVGEGGQAGSRFRERGALVDSDLTLALNLKYKRPDAGKQDESEPAIVVPLVDPGKDWSEASEDFRFASAVAGFGLLLRDSDYGGMLNYDLVLELAGEGITAENDPFGLRKEFLDLVKAGKSLSVTKE